MSITVNRSEYDREFWNKAMRNKPSAYEVLSVGKASGGMFKLPYESDEKYTKALAQEGFFRSKANVISVGESESTIHIDDSDQVAEWVTPGGTISSVDGTDYLKKISVDCHKLVLLTRFNNDLVNDIHFPIEKHLVKKMAEGFGRAEENAFLNGTGVDEPTGILHESLGAEIGVTTSALTFDDVLRLYTSVKTKYRNKGIWVLNDDTALILRTLKDADGNYLWNQNTDTILGKPVFISEYMPDVVSGNKAIAFGDFSYYWIIDRKALAMRTLGENFAFNDETGYRACEYLDGKLIRPEAIKVLQIS